MNSILRGLRDASAAALALYLIWLLHGLAPKVSATVTGIGSDVHAIVRPAQNALAQMAATGKVLAQTGAKERDAFQAQQDSYLALTKKGVEVLDATKQSVLELGDTAKASTSAIQTIGEQARNTLQNAQGTLLATSDAINGLRDEISANGPVIADTLRHVDASAANFEDVTGKFRATMAHFDHMSSDTDTWLHQSLFPSRPKKLLNFAEALAGFAAPIAIRAR